MSTQSVTPVDTAKSVCLKIKGPFFPSLGWKVCKDRFCDLVDEYNQLSEDDTMLDQAADTKIKAIISHAQGNRLSFEDVNSLSALVIRLLPEKNLRIRAEELVADLRAEKFPAAGNPWYEMVLKDWDNLSPQERRYRLVELQTKKRNLSLNSRAGECLKKRLVLKSFIVMGVMLISGILLWITTGPETEHRWMIISGIAGAIGGLISVLHRTCTTPSFELGKTLLDEIPSTLTVYFSPFFGVVGAWIIIMGLQSGLSEFATLTQQNPAPAAVYKLILFSLAAGFSERIIPDTLGKLQARLAAQDSSPARHRPQGADAPA
jgi:hypothetical protein